ncbi:protein ILRUN-like [Artemia franciscana]|uniref:Nbr1 FW domain-containing protein n=1 Tax=Artemia franciscana TaxID=6661 RepID=A0AA88HNV5_ARTSF|nr:hypothetical protein QYM36_010058 [Artemia franciscana]
MDEMEEFETGLLSQFQSMCTTDKDVLITQLKKFVGEEVTSSTAAFFLEMNNWNLQAAICSFFDFQHGNRLPSMAFVADITIGEGESIPPNTRFIKTWRVRNSGTDVWPEDTSLQYINGTQLSEASGVPVGMLVPSEERDISVDMISPSEAGIYTSYWRMTTSGGSYFGDPIWVIITVAEGGVMALTQQLSQLSAERPEHHLPTTSHNPFTSPSKATRYS